jgi:hypothetical protein
MYEIYWGKQKPKIVMKTYTGHMPEEIKGWTC